MGLYPLEKIYEGGLISTARSNVIYSRSPYSGAIRSLRIFVPPVSIGVFKFNVRVNGVAVWIDPANMLNIDASHATDVKTGLNIAVTKGDTVILDLYSRTTGGVVGPIVLIYEIETFQGEVIPVGGSMGQALVKSASGDYQLAWIDLPSAIPTGGDTGQVLAKVSDDDGDADWVDAPTGTGIPNGGTTGQILTKLSDDDGDVVWADNMADPGQIIESREYVLSNEDDVLTSGTKLRKRMPYDFHTTEARSELTTPSSSGNVELDVKVGGTSILDAVFTHAVTSGYTDSTTDVDDLGDGDLVEFVVVSPGTGAKGAKITLIGYRIA